MIRVAMILVLSLVLPAAAIAAPARLTDSQMDFVTAGLVVETSGSATASGNNAKGKVTAKNRVFSRGPLTIGVGKAKAKASACCGDEADVAATATATGEGDIVRTGGHSFEFETRKGKKVARSVAFVLVIEFNPDFSVSK
jgi:hypothetical protein